MLHRQYTAPGHWGFPKGHQDAGESEKETAIRELKEETGIDAVNLLEDKTFTEHYSFLKDSFQYNKSVKYFIGFVPSMTVVTPENFKTEIPKLKWVNYKEAKKLITYPAAKGILDQVLDFLGSI
ncbi:hypothetical protein A2643_00135 [Candidatus Nomurabacteria bacterium RIFCSPHIGHO2_01_FULL_39_220]|uniref:Bis(5'-nucleosyl)-tetraphosphatase [asymmetrical] n=1 Tax=Candidatus Nomurabacteria bacterium RIFCSPLOWO2_02_FULL_40_67 TaxID=1801787 RepID=A0A1F6Y3F3_9BACT|nr:MAG: NUDIX hydrolase [Parcubacteria group bacterium GW2011_GWA2_40_37]KKS11707.1 MAG: NUDIX hydrolase [Parcubacteria group bacterium GW2011_GWB1_41_5]KKS72504.1 MAG: NUDIX hydrolase [Parcubacteria group bacterium GW2011_GWF2_42_7]OGI62614.1 MAG: hypothetical protein A2W12_00480 [Candidatus Nomurabacteria bacterium RBG_16_40_11]OGI69524.1 MAG: hypothetical protein A2643_00135 [Candidatus Nomurabacteria bacterium RIFCSPHIGHO2_01_FULL_39_220]OGI72794.1 MAG: hypothetical protein A2W56_03380 [Ca